MKGMSAVGMVVSVVLVSTMLIAGIWISTSMQSATTLTSSTVSESITFTNATGYAVSYPYISAITSIANSSQTLLAANYTNDGSSITVTAKCGAGTTGCDLSLPYTVTYTSNPQAANDSMAQVYSNTWSGYNLGSISVIVIAAVAIIGILVAGFAGVGGPA